MANTDKKLNEIKDRAKALPKGSQAEKRYELVNLPLDGDRLCKDRNSFK